jgi:hypothetical protein
VFSYTKISAAGSGDGTRGGEMQAGAAGQVAPALIAPSDDKYAAQLKEMQSTAAFGLNIDDVITAKAKGGHDEWKELKFQVRRQYFTFHQVLVSMFWALIAGLFIATLCMALLGGLVWDLTGDGSSNLFMLMNLGVFLVSAGLADMVSGTQAFSGLKKCTGETHQVLDPGSGVKEKKPIVEERYQGSECFTDFDCTSKQHLEHGQYGMCKHHSYTRKYNTWLGLPVAIVGAVMCAIGFGSTAQRPLDKDLFQAAVYGIFAGTAQALIFSF